MIKGVSMYQGRKVFAILLAAGSGRRMNMEGKKQFFRIHGRPLFQYSLHCLEESEYVDGIVMVSCEEDLPYMKEILSKDDGKHEKVLGFFPGGKERYHSVYAGLFGLKCFLSGDKDPIVLVHDSARPMLTHEIVEDSIRGAVEHHASVAGVQSKDTVRILDKDGKACDTPARSSVCIIQTPQAFDYSMLSKAYEKLIKEEEEGRLSALVTDDAMVCELYMGVRPFISRGSYRNIKITTAEDLKLLDLWLSESDGS